FHLPSAKIIIFSFRVAEKSRVPRTPRIPRGGGTTRSVPAAGGPHDPLGLPAFSRRSPRRCWLLQPPVLQRSGPDAHPYLRPRRRGRAQRRLDRQARVLPDV